MKSKKQVSMKQIAEITGVSVATVSRVINNNGRFSEETKERVLKAIEEHGYVTNMAAKSLRISKSKTIGLIVPNINNEWFSSLALEIEKYFFEHNYSVFICNTSQDVRKELEYYKSLDSKLVDGIISISGSKDNPSDSVNRNIPIVSIDRKPDDHLNVHYVESNHYSGGYLATQELIDQGCKDIVLIARDNFLSVNSQRMNGYLQALKDNNLSINKNLQLFIDSKESNFEAASEAIKDLVKKGIHFDGVFATNDWRAYGVVNGLKELGLNVPNDVKVVGFDDNPIANAVSPSLTTIRQNTSEIALKSSQLLMSLMTGDDNLNLQTHYIIPVELIQRESSQ